MDDEDSWRMPSAAQVRAARGLLGWSQQRLAEASGITRRTVTTIEADGSAGAASMAAVASALEQSGIIFTLGDGLQGVTLREGTDR